jgi:hypothetical protein
MNIYTILSAKRNKLLDKPGPVPRITKRDRLYTGSPSMKVRRIEPLRGIAGIPG